MSIRKDGKSSSIKPISIGATIIIVYIFNTIMNREILEILQPVKKNTNMKKNMRAFTTASLEESLNHTFIVLIPKVNALQSFGQFRPISLCNVAYKVKTKVIANRLRKIMPNYTPPNRPPSFMLHHCI